MKLVIIRHGDPDYEKDSLTDVGFKEAELLSERVCKMNVKAFYVSPLGRARATAEPSLKKLRRDAEVLDWLREFPAEMPDESGNGMRCVWDWLPADWTKEPKYFDKDEWMHTDVFEKANVPSIYKNVTDGLDALLKKHGYERDGALYRAVKPNEDTVVLFCHFALECVLLSHLLNVSPMVLWHGMCAAPTSVTTLITEERREGIAYFRTWAFGDVSHLYAANREPSFAARFCETYANKEQRHD